VPAMYLSGALREGAGHAASSRELHLAPEPLRGEAIESERGVSPTMLK
jgi:hypothetical protein